MAMRTQKNNWETQPASHVRSKELPESLYTILLDGRCLFNETFWGDGDRSSLVFEAGSLYPWTLARRQLLAWGYEQV
jgi:hypothetical protein